MEESTNPRLAYLKRVEDLSGQEQDRTKLRRDFLEHKITLFQQEEQEQAESERKRVLRNRIIIAFIIIAIIVIVVSILLIKKKGSFTDHLFGSYVPYGPAPGSNAGMIYLMQY